MCNDDENETAKGVVTIREIGEEMKKMAEQGRSGQMGYFEANVDEDGWKAEAPANLDGSPVDKAEAARVHAGLVSGDVKIEMAPGVAEAMAEQGISIEEVRQLMIASMKKTMS